MKQNYRYSGGAFQIDDYDKQKPFSSFLPGLAGKRGIPLWAFYVNRGQGIASFGIRDKNGAIMEFYPANLAYIYVSKIGFRTFIKAGGRLYEFFRPDSRYDHRQMQIRQSEFTITETNVEAGIAVSVTYYGLPQEDIGALCRHVEITNLKPERQTIEILDGISQILPYGIAYGSYKAIANLLRSWMDVDNLEQDLPFFKLRSSTGDEAETSEIKDGNFYLSVIGDRLVKPLVDLSLIFGNDTSLNHPDAFAQENVAQIKKRTQHTANKVPCGFTGAELELKPKGTSIIDTMIGHISDLDKLNLKAKTMDHAYFAAKRLQAKAEIDNLLEDAFIKTADPVFDEYIRQNYLDNLLRGGYPLAIKTDKGTFTYYLYSRKHGDLERDYNFFQLAPEFYSQGNGNFRDVCQNRRNDCLFHPETGSYNVKMFVSLIQADGYNPLSINGSTFAIPGGAAQEALINELFPDHKEAMRNLLSGRFTPGSLVNTMARLGIDPKMSDEALFARVFAGASHQLEASYGEGYWIDHWTYILDLVENYLHVYPDTETAFLYQDCDYRFFDSPVSVYPRAEKHVLDRHGNVRQYGSLRHPDREKLERLQLQEYGTNWLKDADGGIVITCLFAKLLVLCLAKYALLDPARLGIEMEANKPSWNDAMNGLPGLFGSSMSETVELARLVRFMLNHLVPERELALPVEFIEYAQQLATIPEGDDFTVWDATATIREEYRERIRFGTLGLKAVAAKTFLALLLKAQATLERAITRGITLGGGIIPTYLTYTATRYDNLKHPDGSLKVTHYGLPAVKILEFSLQPLPHFLEAPARYLKYGKDKTKVRKMAALIKQSGLYDQTLKMYKTSDDLDAYGYEIGRIRAFTKGWLEREANFLHMTYKYLYGLLKSGNLDLFFAEAGDNFVCFMDPEVYGRSTLENSSFIATANNPDPAVHGQGFVARLSGSTAEMLSIHFLLAFGPELYTCVDGLLRLTLKPMFPKRFFQDGIIEANLHGVRIRYLNEREADGEQLRPASYHLYHGGKLIAERRGTHLEDREAKLVRDRLVDLVIVRLQ